ncbi:MAG TPA: ABC transporter ATP-binding protein, partial [Lacunisphaera sp.]|nr:ABC transporter ATP-binding protein [Lacunisphaera sp.]
MLRRFIPYLRYLKSNRGTLFAAIFFGLIFGMASGMGFPLMVKYAFPPIFDRESYPLPYSTVLLIAGCVPMIFLLRAVSGYLNSYYVQLTGQRIL